ATRPSLDPLYSVVFTITIVRWASGTYVLATLSAVSSLQLSKRRTLPSLQNVESKYVRGVAPDPVEPSPQVPGSSAPLSVETTSMRNTLKPHQRSGYGAVVRSVLMKVSVSVANLACSDAW